MRTPGAPSPTSGDGSSPRTGRRSSRNSGGEWWLQADVAALATIEQPVLLVAAADSPPEFHQPIEALAGALPNAHTVLVEGGHIIDPAAPEVLAFIGEVLEPPVPTLQMGRSPADARGGRT